MSVQRRWATLSITIVSAGALVIAGASPASAAPIGLGDATSFSVLAGQTVTNTGPSVISGNVGVSPGSAVTNFPPGLVTAPASIFTEGAAAGPKAALTTAYNAALAGPATVLASSELGTQILLPGIYSSPDPFFQITGTLTLDGALDPNAVWIFRTASTLTTAGASVVFLDRAASACNVFWQIGSSATLGTTSTMVGTVMALTSITATTGANVTGRLLARNGAVTLDTNTITTPAACIEASSFSGPGGVPFPLLPASGLELPWVAGSLSLVAVLAGATGVVLAARRRRAAQF